MALASRKSRIRLSFALANERGQMPALLTRSLGKGSLKAIRYIHRTQWRGASSGLYLPAENVRRTSGVCQSWTVGIPSGRKCYREPNARVVLGHRTNPLARESAARGEQVARI